MAEESQTVSQVSGDALDGTLLQSGVVIYKGKEHKLHLTAKGLRLVESNVQSAAGAAAANVPVVDVTWTDVVCACGVSKQKSTQDASDSAFVIHYIHRKADNKLFCKSVMLDTKGESAQSWISQIKEKCKEGKPRKLLIIINPIGGKGTAPQTFEKQVRPVFDLAGVEMIVKVTERAKHAVEIVKTFEASTVDGVIAMGGDGMYMEILHGLTVRKQEEEGINVNDPDAKLVPPTVRVGIIPAGTGNAAAKWLSGILDIDTAVLNIIRGEIGRVNIFSIFEPGKLIQYAGVLLASGYFSAVLERTDELRWMRRARYFYAFAESMISKKKVVDFDIEVLRHAADSENVLEDSGNGAGAAVSVQKASRTLRSSNSRRLDVPRRRLKSAGWTKVGTRQVSSVMTFPSRILENEGEVMKFGLFHPSFDLFLVENGSNWETIKFAFRLMNLSKSVLDMESVKTITDIVGIRFEMKQGQCEGDSKQQEALAELSKLLDIDGELFKLSAPKFELRFHPHFLQVYCVPSLYDSEIKAQT